MPAMPHPAKLKKWARRARFIVIHLDPKRDKQVRAVHLIEIRDSKKRVVRERRLQYHNTAPALSTIMADAQARLARNDLVIDADSYEFRSNGRLLRASVALAPSHHSVQKETGLI